MANMDLKKIIPLICLVFILAAAASVFITQDSDKTTMLDLDFSDVQTIEDKKVRFFSFLHPIVVEENNRIREQRKKIITAVETDDHIYVQSMLNLYKLPEDAPVERLLKRADIVPFELVLAQSANESMWGQSRFAREGNNLFGQWTYEKGKGMVPLERNGDAIHEVAVFDSVNDSVRSYLMNINTHDAYRELRDIRKNIRDNGEKLSGMALAEGLSRYSERGQDYVNEIKTIIKVNDTLMAVNPSPTTTN